jgi:radical SAM-linked protein
MRRFSYRLDVNKLNEAAFLSHRDVIRVISRGLIRSQLPIHTSGGHKWPSPKISVLNPLPTGVESEHEVVTFKLCSYFPPSEVRERIEPIAFPGLDVIDITPLSGSSTPAIQEMTFRIEFEESLTESFTYKKEYPDAAGNGRSKHSSSVPEQLLELTCSNETCVYRTGTDGRQLHPESVLNWLREHQDAPLPPVRNMIKTNIITER